MRKLLALFLCLALTLTPVSAGHLTLLGAGKPAAGGGGGGNVTWTPTANPPIQAGTANPQRFTSVNIGTAAADRYVIVCTGQTSNGPVTAVTVNGVSATQAVDSVGTSGAESALWYANVTSGTSVTIDVTLTAGFPSFAGIAVGTINTATPTPGTTSSNPGAAFRNDPQTTAASVTVPSNGIAVLCAATTNVNATPTYNNWNANYNIVSGTSFQLLLGNLSATGTPSVSGFAFSDFGIVAAPWGP